MGLDVVAWKNAEISEEFTLRKQGMNALADDFDDRVDDFLNDISDNNVIEICTSFPSQALPYSDGICLALSGDMFHFRAGSYSGYNHWRNTLSVLVHSVGADAVWDNINDYEGKAFVELINFSDAEGVISHIAAKKLANDFNEYHEIVKAYKTEIDYTSFLGKYESFKKAFELASENGVVIFS